ncbi:YeiH family protein [Isobaculum melis]|uniref:Conserved hypothetical integral membrane protein n=1 Tax=Isobaculum melis TaxID=142588 RepID=A0A1H9U8W3_9LACT|nr:putative sulfate exporter family transporter [Isobaculum melis]SES05905.1 conserved hypothetical integral membrane protein [Isobaculum melis]
MKDFIKSIIPGLALCIGVTLMSKYLATFVPQFGAATLAIFIGILLGNTVFKQPILDKGTKFSESKLLEYSVVLLGGTITFQTIRLLGLSGVLFIILQMTATIIAAILIGKKLKLSQQIYLLMASGNAVCGSSAIASTAPTVGASDEEKGLVITIVNLMGTVLMLLLPVISFALYHHDKIKSSALIGGTLQSVGQVVASGSMVNTSVQETATIFKIMRIIFLVAVVFIFGKMAKKEPQSASLSTAKKTFKLPIPWYVLGFLIVCCFASLQLIPAAVSQLMHQVSSWFEIIALAGIGLRLKMNTLLKQGKEFLIYALSLGSIQVIFAITFIWLLFS